MRLSLQRSALRIPQDRKTSPLRRIIRGEDSDAESFVGKGRDVGRSIRQSRHTLGHRLQLQL